MYKLVLDQYFRDPPVATDLPLPELSQISEQYYGWTVDTPEWSLTARFSSGQSAHTRWIVILTEIDEGLESVNGFTVTEWPTAVAIANAIRFLTRHWTEPLQVEIK